MARVNRETLKGMMTLLGYDWSDEELDRFLPLVEKNQEMIDKLDALPLGEVEPGIQYRIL